MKKFIFLILIICSIAGAKIWRRGSVGGGGGTPVIPFTFTAPLERQINQRRSGQCQITLQGTTLTGTVAQAQATPVAASGIQTGWQTINIDDTGVNGAITVTPGWYTIEMKIYNGLTYISNEVSEKVGCGDNIMVSGQSNGTNYYTPDDFTPPADMINSRGITAMLPWRLATDPQDSADNTHSSIVPALGALLSAHTGFPVGFISNGLGNTTVNQWIPAGPNYQRIRDSINLFPGKQFLTWIWIQGENDAAFSTSQASYYADLRSIGDQINTDAGYVVPCGIPVAETHPNEVTGAGTIAGQTQMAASTGCYVGANPDSLNNTYRSDTVHFNTTTGQLAHATLWYNSIVSNFGL